MKEVLIISIKRLVAGYHERFVLGVSLLSAALQPVVTINQIQQQQQRILFKEGRPR